MRLVGDGVALAAAECDILRAGLVILIHKGQ